MWAEVPPKQRCMTSHCPSHYSSLYAFPRLYYGDMRHTTTWREVTNIVYQRGPVMLSTLSDHIKVTRLQDYKCAPHSMRANVVIKSPSNIHKLKFSINTKKNVTYSIWPYPNRTLAENSVWNCKRRGRLMANIRRKIHQGIYQHFVNRKTRNFPKGWRKIVFTENPYQMSRLPYTSSRKCRRRNIFEWFV